MQDILPSGRPRSHIPLLLDVRVVTHAGPNRCSVATLKAPQGENHEALANAMRRILPFMYRDSVEVQNILSRLGMDFPSVIPIPTDPDFQWAHLGEFLTCAYAEECDHLIVLTYKWRLNTAKNQHQYGMDILGFDLSQSPPLIHAIAVKTTRQGSDGSRPSVVYTAIRELLDYVTGSKLDNDLAIIAANLRTEPAYRDVFLDWYDPYTIGIPSAKPALILEASIVIDQLNWLDSHAIPIIETDFQSPACGIVLAIAGLEDLASKVFIQGI